MDLEENFEKVDDYIDYLAKRSTEEIQDDKDIEVNLYIGKIQAKRKIKKNKIAVLKKISHLKLRKTQKKQKK